MRKRNMDKQESLQKIYDYAAQCGKDETFQLLLDEVLWSVLSTPIEDLLYDCWSEEDVENIDEQQLNIERENLYKDIYNCFQDTPSLDVDEAFDTLCEVLTKQIARPDLMKIAEELWEWQS